jgi:hypothetical protein
VRRLVERMQHVPDVEGRKRIPVQRLLFEYGHRARLSKQLQTSRSVDVVGGATHPEHSDVIARSGVVRATVCCGDYEFSYVQTRGSVALSSLINTQVS